MINHLTILAYFLSAICLLLSLAANAQVYVRNYEVTSDGKAVGKISASREVDGDYLRYEISSAVSMRVIFTINVTYKVEAVFKDDLLISSSATVYMNGNVQSDVNLERTGDHYTVVSDGHTSRIYDKISQTSASLYFNKPNGSKKSFSETEGTFKTLVLTSDGNFKLKDPDKESNFNVLTYASDQGLASIEIERAFMPSLKVRQVRGFD